MSVTFPRRLSFASFRMSISAGIALYLNVFVLVVQLFRKVAALKELAPTQTEPPFAVAQLVVMIAFIVLGWIAAKKFRIPAATAA